MGEVAPRQRPIREKAESWGEMSGILGGGSEAGNEGEEKKGDEEPMLQTGTKSRGPFENMSR